MKGNFAVVFFVVMSFSCSDDRDANTTLVGKWKKIAAYTDPGDGSGTFVSVESNQIIQFNSDSTFYSNESICLDGSDNAEEHGVYSEKHLFLDGCSEENLRYDQDGVYVIITHQCYEGCFEKYIRLD